MARRGSLDPKLEQYRNLWENELAGAALYRALADSAHDKRKSVFISLAEAEEAHARHWAEELEASGVKLGKPHVPFRVRAIRFLARRFGTDAVLPMVMRFETAGASVYEEMDDAPTAMAKQEQTHGRIVAAMSGGETQGGRIAAGERRHRAGAGGALRASVFGVNDGLLSNLSLVMGVAGGTADNKFVLLAGIAGLVAGAFSMASGEWISIKSQRELYENELKIEKDELAAFPEEEREELELIYQAKGIDASEAKAMVDRIMRRPDVALDTLAREELGIDPTELGSPWVAAISSFLAFAVGASLPVLPYVFTEGAAAFVLAASISIAALFAVGGAISVFTGRNAWKAGIRMVAIGVLVASVTFGVGKLVGVSVG
ncbi:MAG: VIT1/CCC1 transporter family protein [Acidimicrobiia bacterium]